MDYTLYDDDTIRHVVNTARDAGKNVCLANLYPDADPVLKSAFLDAETGLAVEEYDGSLDTAFEKHGFTHVRDVICIAGFLAAEKLHTLDYFNDITPEELPAHFYTTPMPGHYYCLIFDVQQQSTGIYTVNYTD